jgi:hypothetical protein
MIRSHLASAALCCALLQVHAPDVAAQDTNPAVVLEWNQLAHATIPAAAGPLGLRYYAILHSAMFDAANSIERRYTPFHTAVNASSGASPEAAVAQAAHDVLAALIPGAPQQAAYHAALSARLATLPPGRASQGVAVGKAVASRILQWRANDGIFGPPIPYGLPQLPGLWQPAVPGGQPGLSQLPAATPFTMKSITQFLTPRHPELTSARYAADFEEVKTVGKTISATRTPYQTQTAQLFAGVGTSTNVFILWNNVARDVTLARHLSLIESARLHAFLNASMMDSLLSTQTGKFTYGLWRPSTAIPGAADDLNPATMAEPGWTPLLGTPPYPSYPGNMAGIGSCASKALATGIETDDVHFSVTWTGVNPNPNVTRHYTSFSQLAQEEADSRIYGGIHYRFDNEASQASCTGLVAHAYASLMRPR